MPALKIFGKRIGGPKEEDFKKRITEGKEPVYGLLGNSEMVDKIKKEGKYTPETEARSRRSLNQWTMRGDKKADKELNITPGEKNFSITPKQNKPVKVVKKEVSVETPTGDIGSVDRTADVIGPNMSAVNKEEPRSQWTDPHEQARRMMGFKKGGKVKSKCMSSGGKVGSASKRADGCATKGKTKGRII